MSNKESSDLGCFSMVAPLVGMCALSSAWNWSLGEEPRAAVRNGLTTGSGVFIGGSIVMLLVAMLIQVYGEDKK